jgi:hypothetical protein
MRVGTKLFTIYAAVAILFYSATSTYAQCNADNQKTDDRGTFDASFYVGLGIDSFAGDETLKYINPGASGQIFERGVGGFDFAYRLTGGWDTVCKPETTRNTVWRAKEVWVYGETVHGVRSADVNCTQHSDLPVCQQGLSVTQNPGNQLYFMLRNATTLEGFAGFRWEFLGLQQQSSAPANLYLKAQAGFLSVAGTKGSALDLHHIGLGAITTKGEFQNSYLELGYGRSDLFATARRKRLKIDGYLEAKLPGVLQDRVSLFTQLFVDTDLGKGSDAIQSYIGFTFDLNCLVISTKCGSGSGK